LARGYSLALTLLLSHTEKIRHNKPKPEPQCITHIAMYVTMVEYETSQLHRCTQCSRLCNNAYISYICIQKGRSQFIYVTTTTILTREAIFLKIAHICIHFTDARNTADVIENLMVLERQKNITRISMTPLEFVEPQMTRSVYICLRISTINNMTRPGLEPGISGSGGRRLIH
jgi:hypothetical protein